MRAKAAASSSPVVVAPVVGAKDFGRFIDVPYRIYRDDPHWVAPLRMEMRKLFDVKKNPFFEHAEAAFWIATRDGAPVGRISAQINRLHLELHKDGAGNFGCLEAIDDPAVFGALLRQAESWLAERGMKKALGPYTVSVNDEIGVLVDGFDAPPNVQMAHSPRYYAPRLEEQGYAKAMDLFAFTAFTEGGKSQALVERVERTLGKLRAEGRLTTRCLDPKRFKQDMRLALDIYNDAWRDNWGFVPVTEAEAEALIDSLSMILKPEGVVFGMLDGKEEAFAVGIPNLNEAIADLKGKLFPLGIVKLLWRLKMRPPTSARIMLAGVKRDYRNSPLSAALISLLVGEIIQAGRKHGIKSVEMSWVLENNVPSIALCRSAGELTKTYRLYEKALPSA